MNLTKQDIAKEFAVRDRLDEGLDECLNVMSENVGNIIGIMIALNPDFVERMLKHYMEQINHDIKNSADEIELDVIQKYMQEITIVGV